MNLGIFIIRKGEIELYVKNSRRKQKNHSTVLKNLTKGEVFG